MKPFVFQLPARNNTGRCAGIAAAVMLFIMLFTNAAIGDVVDDSLPPDSPQAVKDSARHVTRSGLQQDKVIKLTRAMLQNKFNEQQIQQTHALMIEAKNGGQFGLSLRYYAEKLRGTEFGFYYLNYHSRLPLISGAAVTSLLDFRTGKYWTEYPENIHLWGASFNTTVGTWALSGEVTYRPNAPLQIDDVEILFAGLTPLNVLFPAPALQFHSQLGDYAAGETIVGYEDHKS